MRYLLLVITPREDGQEAWFPHWFESESLTDALHHAKGLAFSEYEKSTVPLERYRFELFRADSILPTTHNTAWLTEFLSKKT